MAYGLKCWTPTSYVSFDSTVMSHYVKIVVSGTVTLTAGAQTTISSTGYQYAYVFGPTPSGTAVQSPFTLTKLTDSFTIKSNLAVTATFGYLACRLN